MIKKYYIFTLLLTLGLLFASSVGYACESKSMTTEKSCCNKEKASKSSTKECCKDKPSKDKHNGCDGKCGHSNCTTSSINFSFILTNVIKLDRINFDFSTEKQKFYTPEIITSAGFYILWVIPKIS